MRIRRGRIQRDDAGHARDLSRDMVREQDVVARQLTRSKGRCNFAALHEYQRAHRPTERIDHIGTGLPSLRRHHRYIDSAEGCRHLVARICLFKSRHVQAAQRLRFGNRAIDRLP